MLGNPAMAGQTGECGSPECKGRHNPLAFQGKGVLNAEAICLPLRAPDKESAEMTTPQTTAQRDIDTLCVNTIRSLAMDAIQNANSGHPGAPMGLAPAAYVLWTRVMKHNPRNPAWLDRDRFVLSGGHASMLLYSLLHLTGYDLSLDDIRNFRQLGSKTPGHPEFGLTPGVETTTGPLGQGFANAVGMAMAERHLAGVFNRDGFDIVNHYTYAICGDGDLMEGIASEAASLAGHLGLGRLICIYDDNRISIEGSTDITFTEDVGLRFESYGWQVVRVEDGNDLAAIEKALKKSRADSTRPSLIVLRTEIAYGSPNKQGSADAHGAPLGEAEVCLTKECLGCPSDELFCVPAEALQACGACLERGKRAEERWNATFKAYAAAHPESADAWLNAVSGFVSRDWTRDLPTFDAADGPVATRSASGKVLNAMAERLTTLVGGSADLAPSNKTYLDGFTEFQKDRYDGRNIRFGVREHAMAGIMNGMFLHHGVRPYGGTFLVFADYMRPAIRLACLMNLSVIYVFTHDSVAVGEDGPTHQPIEHLASLRLLPGLTVIRPADATETVEAWRKTIQATGPVALILSRQKLPVIDRKRFASAAGLANGAYILSDCEGSPDVLLIASGSEVHLALEAADRLMKMGIRTRVVSMPSWELFEKSPADYRRKVLPPTVTRRIVIEAGHPMGWERYAGAEGVIVGIRRFGTSAPGAAVMKKLGFTADAIVEKATALMKK
jgi:transketolase